METQKDNLILIIGPSGVGKTSAAEALEKLGYNVIHSYTTRGPREENEWGHIFVDSNALLNTAEEDMLAYADLYQYQYWATKDQYRGKGTVIYVVCPVGAADVYSKVSDANITTIFLMADEEVRAKRMYATRTKEKVEERLRDDRWLFKTSKCDYFVDANRELKKVVNDISDIIQNNILVP